LEVGRVLIPLAEGLGGIFVFGVKNRDMGKADPSLCSG
jgi:hypothetical protein